LSLRNGGRIAPTLWGRQDHCIPAGRLKGVLEERRAIVVEVKPFDVHGSGFVDVTVVYQDRRTDTARIGREGAPEDLRAGDEVVARLVMGTIVEVVRAQQAS
jgi:hypothetical protein